MAAASKPIPDRLRRTPQPICKHRDSLTATPRAYPGTKFILGHCRSMNVGRGAHGQDHSTAVKRIRINAGSAATASGAEQVRVIAVTLDSQDARTAQK